MSSLARKRPAGGNTNGGTIGKLGRRQGRAFRFQRRQLTTVAVTVGLLSALAAVPNAASAISVVTPRAPVAQEVGSVDVAHPRFWDGPRSETVVGNFPYAFETNLAQTEASETCGVTNPCWAYQFRVSEKATTLRVGMDTNTRGDCYQVELYAPGTYGDSQARPHVLAPQCPELNTETGAGIPQVDYVLYFAQIWNMDIRVTNPALGDWTVRVVPLHVQGWGFRLRASLHNAAVPTYEIETPNLQMWPPYEFGFAAPAHPQPGRAADRYNAASTPGLSCSRDENDEAVENGQPPLVRCLRFSTGMYNVGPGPLELVLNGDGDVGSVTQRLRSDDGKVAKERDAGSWEYHESHGHRHYSGFVTFELYRVVDAGVGAMDPQGTKRLELLGTGRKSGWNSTDQRMADWQSFDQDSQFGVLRGCWARGESCITLANGWADHYRWQRPGNFLEFPVNVAGSDLSEDYVVLARADGADRVKETSEHDNAAYSWIRVQGDEVRICERGIGISPWDPRKVLHPSSYWFGTPGGTTADGPSEPC